MSDDVVATFMAITGCADEDTAIQFLAMCDFNLDAAVPVYNDAHPNARGASSGGGSAGGPSRSEGARAHSADDDADRPAITQRQVTRLVDMEGPPLQGALHGMATGFESIAQQLLGQRRDRDFTFDGAPTPPEQPPASALEALYRPPSFAFNRDFKSVCAEAQLKSRWVILNVLVRGEWGSGCINRDLWRDDMVKALVPSFALLFQCVSDTPEGQEAIQTYNLNPASLPCLFIVNPLTRAIMREIPLAQLRRSTHDQSLDPERFLNLVTDFTDRHEVASFPEFPQAERGGINNVGVPAGGGGVASVHTHDTDTGGIEDEMLRVALEMSAREAGVPTPSLPERGSGGDGGRAEAVPNGTNPPSAGYYDVGDSSSGDAEADLPGDEEGHPAQHRKEERGTHGGGEEEEEEEIDIEPFRCRAGDEGALKLRFKLPHGPVDEVLSSSMPAAALLQHLVQLLRAQGQCASKANVELLFGFPPKRLPLDVLLRSNAALGDAGIRSGETLTPHVTS